LIALSDLHCRCHSSRHIRIQSCCTPHAKAQTPSPTYDRRYRPNLKSHNERMVTSVTTYVNSWSKYCSLSPAGKCEREPTASPYQCRQCPLINMLSVRSGQVRSGQVRSGPFECRRHRKTGEHGLRTMAHLDSDHQPPRHIYRYKSHDNE